jgi:hypothetical protein
MMIKIRYSSVDGVRTLRSFSTLAGARRYAHERVGKHPDIGTGYAISDDGIGKIEVYGEATLADLFGEEPLDAA